MFHFGLHSIIVTIVEGSVVLATVLLQYLGVRQRLLSIVRRSFKLTPLETSYMKPLKRGIRMEKLTHAICRIYLPSN